MIKQAQEERVVFTEAMRETHTVLVPQMAPYHFGYLVEAFKSEGYKAELLQNDSIELIHEGMKYSHNDICVPAMLVIGQFIDALKTRPEGTDKVALIITQTGGACRASNYISLLRKALKKAKLGHVPVISLNASGFEKNPGFVVGPVLLHKLHDAILLGDLMMMLTQHAKAYAQDAAALETVIDGCEQRMHHYFKHRRLLTWHRANKTAQWMIGAFKALSFSQEPKPKVGVVGEIYVKYSPLGNNHLEALLEQEGVEVVTPPIYDFFLYSFDSKAHDIKRYGGKATTRWAFLSFVKYIEWRRGKIRRKLKKAGYDAPVPYAKIKALVNDFLDVGLHAGEGWLLTAEMIDLITHGVPNIVCTQPFGCLPNHIAGKGMFKKLKKVYPEANIVAIDYDTSASTINQKNRISLMLANAFEQLKIKEKSS